MSERDSKLTFEKVLRDLWDWRSIAALCLAMVFGLFGFLAVDGQRNETRALQNAIDQRQATVNRINALLVTIDGQRQDIEGLKQTLGADDAAIATLQDQVSASGQAPVAHAASPPVSKQTPPISGGTSPPSAQPPTTEPPSPPPTTSPSPTTQPCVVHLNQVCLN